MEVTCKYCGEKITIPGVGRPRKEVPLEVIKSTLMRSASLAQAAASLSVSPAFIRQRLQTAGERLAVEFLKPKS